MLGLILIGIAIGFILALVTVSATLWCVQLTLQSGYFNAILAILGIALGQAFWAGIAYFAYLLILFLPFKIGFGLQFYAAIVFIYFAIRIYRAPRVTQLHAETLECGSFTVFIGTLLLSIGMLNRFFLYLALAIVARLQIYGFGLNSFPVVVAATVFGAILWMLYIMIIAKIAGPRVPESISLRSLNKLYFLSSAALGVLTVISLSQV